MSEENPNYRWYFRIGVAVMIVGGVAQLVAQFLNNLFMFIGGLVTLVIGAIIVGGTGKGRWGRTVRALVEALWYVP